MGQSFRRGGAADNNPGEKEIKKLQKRVEELSMAEPTMANKAEFLAVSKTLDELLLKQEVYWA